MYKVILFDLDGTLTESGEGITKSVQYALERIGKPEPDLEKLKVFIGPPLMEMFMQYAQIDEATAKQAVEIYRERYSVTGIFENALYPGIENMLAQLEKKGYILAVASSKPEVYVRDPGSFWTCPVLYRNRRKRNEWSKNKQDRSDRRCSETSEYGQTQRSGYYGWR